MNYKASIIAGFFMFRMNGFHGAMTLQGGNLLDNADGTGSTLLDNAGAHYPEHIVPDGKE